MAGKDKAVKAAKNKIDDYVRTATGTMLAAEGKAALRAMKGKVSSDALKKKLDKAIAGADKFNEAGKKAQKADSKSAPRYAKGGYVKGKKKAGRASNRVGC